MKILVICNRTKLLGRMDLNILYNLDHLSRFADVIYWGEGWGYNVLIEEVIAKYNPQLVYYAGDAGSCDYSSAPNVRLPKVIYMEDYWSDLDERLGILEVGNFDYLVTKNKPCVDFYLNKFPHLKHILNPHGYNSDIFKYEEVEKKWDFTVCGRIDERYRLRSKVLDLVGSLDALGYKVYVKPHPGYWDRGEARIDDGQRVLAKVANQSRVCLAGCGTGNQCHMAKIWELSATSAVCFTDANPLDGDYEKIGQHVHLCDVNWDDQKILDEIRLTIDNWQVSKFYSFFNRYASIVERARDLVLDFERIVR